MVKKRHFWQIPVIVFFGCLLLSAGLSFLAGDNTNKPDSGFYSSSTTSMTTAGTASAAAESDFDTTAGQASGDDEFLLSLLQGMWVTDRDIDGGCTRLIVHNNVAAMTHADPLSASAEPRNWTDSEWRSDTWSWQDCRLLDGRLILSDGINETPLGIKPVSDFEFIMEFYDIDMLVMQTFTFYKIQPPEDFMLSDFLTSSWVSVDTLASDSTIHGQYIFGADNSGEIGRAKITAEPGVFEYEPVFTISYSTHGMSLSLKNQYDETSNYTVDILDFRTIVFGDITFTRIG